MSFLCCIEIPLSIREHVHDHSLGYCMFLMTNVYKIAAVFHVTKGCFRIDAAAATSHRDQKCHTNETPTVRGLAANNNNEVY